MVIPLVLAGPSGSSRGETIQNFIAEQERQVALLRQSAVQKRKNSIDKIQVESAREVSETTTDSSSMTIRETVDSNSPTFLSNSHRRAKGRRIKRIFSRGDLRSSRTTLRHGELQDLRYVPQLELEQGALPDLNSFDKPLATSDAYESIVFPTPVHPMAQSLRAIAKILVTPLGKEFAIDPLKMGSRSVLMDLELAPVVKRARSRDAPFRVLDMGGYKTDEYTAQLATAAAGCSVHVHKAILGPSGGRVIDISSHGCQIEATTDLAMLPYPDAYFDVISARSLHKGTKTYSHAAAGDIQTAREKSMRECLAECERMLLPGGRLEYIYFEDELANRGPLGAEMEQLLWEVWCDMPEAEMTSPGCPQFAQVTTGISVEKFKNLLNEAGFQGGKSLVTNFPVFTICQLFDHRGCRRTIGTPADARIHRLHPDSPDDLCRNPQTARLFAEIREECESRNTGWRCVVGWAVKADRQRVRQSE